nr:MAG TPA: hypothetical protein [Caudoviricetes sp.]
MQRLYQEPPRRVQLYRCRYLSFLYYPLMKSIQICDFRQLSPPRYYIDLL